MVRAAGWRRERHRAVQALFSARLDGRNDRQQHGFLSIFRLLSGRLLAHLPPISARGGSGRPCGGAVDQVKVPIGRLHQSFKQPPPYAFGRPTMEAIVDGGRGAVASGTIVPPAAGSQYMDDAANYPAVVGSMVARLVRWKQRRDHRPLPIIKPEFSRHSPKLPLSGE